MPTGPSFLLIKAPGADTALLARWADAVRAARGTVLAAAAPDAVQTLEPGTVHTALLIARFPWAPDIDGFWARAGAAIAGDAPAGSVVLAAEGLPWEGWPGDFVPTIATVTLPASAEPRAYMLIEGDVSDEARIDSYRDVILPMLRERGAYYPMFVLGGGVRVLHGAWARGVLAISRWPDVMAAQGFWFSDRYQTVAVPLRTGAGAFDVQLTAGIDG